MTRIARPSTTIRRTLVGAAAAALTATLSITPAAHASGPELDTSLDRMVAEGPAVGAVADAEWSGGSWTGAAGLERPGSGSGPAAPGDAVRVGSVSKTFVATLVMKRVQAGTWHLTDTVGEVAPGLLPRDRQEVTLQQLLSHRSGLPDYLGAMVPKTKSWWAFVRWHRQDTSEPAMLAAANGQPVLFEPGARWSYSNTNYLVLGMLLERESGERLADLIRTEITEPLGLKRTYLDEDPGIESAHLTESIVYRDDVYSLYAADPSVFGAAGAVVSTAEELNRFYEALLTGTLVRGDYVDRMVAPRALKGSMAYGLGIYSLPDPCDANQRVYGHDGATFGTLTMSYHSRDGKRHATLAMTGRPYDGQDAKNMPVIGQMLLEGCPAGAQRNPQAAEAFAEGSTELAAR